jgi:hypothetical protein
MWERHNGNISLFIRSSLNQWLGDIGALQLWDSVDIDLAIVDDLKELSPKKKSTSLSCSNLCRSRTMKIGTKSVL